MGVKTFRTVVSVIFVLGLIVSGCAKPPVAQVDAVKAALADAKTAEADRYAKDEYSTANSSLAAAQSEIDHQNSRFALLRKYNQAKQMLTKAQADAQAAKSAADTNKAQVRSEAESTLQQTQTAIADAKTLMESAPKGKEGKAALELIQTDLTTLETSLPDVTTTITSGDFLAAKDQAQSKLAKANSIKQELQDAIAKQAELSASKKAKK
ncbi:hypothetical protein HYR99_08200 [Candidatus Poribacteria bacterium]|nr:hypothetical protein [Candidatus Poribacteria bacterium]